MSKNPNPCLGCTEREIGCHAWCERYKRYDAKNKERLARHRLENDAEIYSKSMAARNLDYAAKRRKKRAGQSKPAGRSN